MADLAGSIRGLSVAEKFDLLDAIWEDLAAHAPEALSEEQAAEMDRRLARYKQDPDAVVSWEHVKEDLFRQ